jgi:hypothetical protein
MGIVMRNRLVASLVAVLVLMPFVGVAHAISGTTLSPTSQEVSVAPGETYHGTLSVNNDGSTATTYKIAVSDYKVSDESYHADFNSSGASNIISPVTWFSFPVTTFTLASGADTILNYEIKVPPRAAVGGHYASVFVANVPPPATGGTVISRIQKLGVLFYISVTGAVSLDGSIASFDAPALQWNSPLLAKLRIRNSGNDHFSASGEATVRPLFGSPGLPVQFKGEVLPGTTRLFPITIPTKSPIGIYEVSVTPHYLNSNGPVLKRWVLLIPPLTLIIILTTLALVIAFIIGLAVRRLRRNHSA